MPGFNIDSFQRFVDRHLEREGTLRDAVFAAGQFWDLHFLTMTRDAWTSFATSPLGRRIGEGVFPAPANEVPAMVDWDGTVVAAAD